MTADSGRGTHRWAIGILLVAIGLLILLENLDVLDLGSFVTRWWPLLILLVGLWKLIVWGAQSLGTAVLLMIIGVLCLLATLNVIAWGEIFRLWPILLISIGTWILLRPVRHFSEKFRATEGEDADILDAWALFGGADRRLTCQQFRGGKATALFGGINIDLRQAMLAEGEHALDLSAVFGGIDVLVPEDWDVWITGSPIWGGLEDRRRKVVASDMRSKGRLHINAFVIFGAVEIKN
jgi:predicted membrane protein